jgi:hypothetical protein
MRVIDDTDADLRTLITADFRSVSIPDLHAAFLNWLHYKARRVPALPRAVYMSTEVTSLLPTYAAISKIAFALRNGFEVEHWLSDAKTRRANHAADLMFNDWQISHFHLGDFFQTPSVVRRTGPLLFAHISAAEATLLDVQLHGAWTSTVLLEILLRTNPRALEKYEAKGITPSQLTDEQYKNLRANGANAAIAVNGRAFMPGMGLMSSRHSMRLVLYADHLRRWVQDLSTKFQADQVPTELKAAIYRSLGVPVRMGVIYSGGALLIIDKNRGGLVLGAMRPLE